MRLLIVSTILLLASWPGLAGRESPPDAAAAVDGQVADSSAASVNAASPTAAPPSEVPPSPVAAAEGPPEPEPAVVASRTISREELCDALASAAQANDLPVGFFARLIWQESRFVASAVSRAGAQGVAQFMPPVAAELGLSDPFDPLQALPKSAEFLRALRREFGNLGLAAAAYNAGAGRIKGWLERRAKLPERIRGRAKLPKETQDYVTTITGHAPERWIVGAPERADFTVPARLPCRQAIDAEQEAQAELRTQAAAAGGAVPLPPQRPAQARAALLKPSSMQPRARDPESAPAKPWGVQLAGDWSETKARDTFERLRRKHPAVLGHRSPLVVRSKLAGGGATMHRIRIALETRAGAEQLCATLRSAGGACAVLRN
jgi:transglycosylase-like protein with SLT domain